MVKKPVAKKKTAAKKTVKPAKFLIPIPVDHPLPFEEHIEAPCVEPAVFVEPPMPLAEPLESFDCVVTVNKTFWAGLDYIVITPATGSKFPYGLETGRIAKVTFAPPG